MTDKTPELGNHTIQFSDGYSVQFRFNGELILKQVGEPTDIQPYGSTNKALTTPLEDADIDDLIHHLHEVLEFRRWTTEQDHISDDDLVNVGRIEERREQRDGEFERQRAEYAKTDRRNNPKVRAQAALQKAMLDALQNEDITPDDIAAALADIQKNVVVKVENTAPEGKEATLEVDVPTPMDKTSPGHE